MFSYPSAFAIAKMLQHIAHPSPLMKLGTGLRRGTVDTRGRLVTVVVVASVVVVDAGTGRAACGRLLSIFCVGILTVSSVFT